MIVRCNHKLNYARHLGFNSLRGGGGLNFFFLFFFFLAVQYFLLQKILKRSITTNKEIDLLQENISLVFLKIEKQNMDSVPYQTFTLDIQTAKNSRAE